MTTTGAGAASGVTHPLDPLTAEEIRAAVEIVRAQGRLTDRARFPTVALREPPKSDVLAFEDNGALDRQALAADYEWFRQHRGLTATVDLNQAVDDSFANYAVSVLGTYR